MRILALEPYYGGSHRAFLDGWAKYSAHEWTLLTLPATKWKWRMRHAALTFAAELDNRMQRGESWDLLLCSDMLNLAEFRGLVDQRLRVLPAVAYFHENQLTYPVRVEQERDYHFAMTNVTTALAATAVWFNSAFHRDSFLDASETFLRRMPDYQPLEAITHIRDKTEIFPPGIETFPFRGARKPGPLHILWAARWEHDKNPEDFFQTLRMLGERGVAFRVSVIGQQFAEIPEVFGRAKEQFAESIVHWGYQARRDDYAAALSAADVFVSTAHHEFFGISAVEAIAAGAFPLLPRRLSYPEIIGDDGSDTTAKFFYDGSLNQLAEKLVQLAEWKNRDGTIVEHTRSLALAISKFAWPRCACRMDEQLDKFVNRR